MNCDNAKTDILLAASGELDAAGRKELDLHLVTCAGCREYRAFLDSVSRAAGPALMSGGPSSATLGAIAARGAEARKTTVGQGRIHRFSPAAVIWMAAAAALVVLASFWQFSTPVSAPDISTVARASNSVADMNALLSVADGNDEGTDVQEQTPSESVVEDLARQLLIYQGFEDTDAWGGAEATESGV